MNNDRLPTKANLDATSIYTAVLDSDASLAERTNDSSKLPRAFSDAAFRLIRLNNQDITLDGYAMRVAAQLPELVRASDALNSSVWLPEKEYREAKLEVVKFNHALREMIDAYSELTYPGVVGFVRDMALKLNYDMETICRIPTGRIVSGMRHEIAVEAALGELMCDGAIDDYELPTAEEDMKGIDVVAIMPNGDRIAIDVKATQRQVEERSGTRYKNGPILVWSGLNFSDFGDRMRVSNELIRQKVVKRIRAALQS